MSAPAHPTTHPKETPMADDTVRPFADWLLELNGGKTHAELGEALHALTAAVRDTGKKGRLLVTFEVAPLDKGPGDALVVVDAIKTTAPTHDRKRSIFYPDRHGNLTRTDPDQLPFESLREVPAGPTPIHLDERSAQ